MTHNNYFLSIMPWLSNKERIRLVLRRISAVVPRIDGHSDMIGMHTLTQCRICTKSHGDWLVTPTPNGRLPRSWKRQPQKSNVNQLADEYFPFK